MKLSAIRAIVALWVVVLGMAFFMAFLPHIVEAVSLIGVPLLSGWIAAASRLPATAPGVKGIALTLGALATITFGTQRLCSWLSRSIGTAGTRGWRWKWTLSAHAAIWCGAFAGFCFIALAHQTAWLIASGEPLLTARRFAIFDGQQLAQSIYLACETNGWRAREIESSFWNRLRNPNERYAAVTEKHRLIVLHTNGVASAFIIASRKPQHWIIVARSNSPPRAIDSNQLPGILASGSLQPFDEERKR